MNHYQPMQKAHTRHTTTGNYSRYQTGKLVGEYRDIPAVIIDEAGFDGLGVQTQVGGADDAWCLVNVFDHLHRYVDSVAINGAIDADHAVCVALGQFDHLETAYGKIVSAEDASFDQMHWSSTAIYRVLSDDRQNAHYLPIINHKQLYDAATRITGLSVQWDGINPVSHGGISQLLLDMQKHDTYHEMVQRFDLTQALSDAQPMQLDAFDALVESHNRLDLFKERLFRAMAKTPQDDIRAVNVTLTKPFKRQGVANIAMVFELSDGQHISIWFHNPDANPNKLGATDIMASWKWLLNRRDVTAALSPPNGANVQLPMLAHRMMRLAAKNSKRFIAAQKRKQANQAKLAAAQSLVDERLAKLSEQDEEIERLSQQLASLTPTQAPQTTAKAVMVDVDAEVVGAASDDPDERLHAKPEQAVIHNPQQMAQKAVQDEYDEPVVLTGKEFGEFDLTTEAGKKSLRETVADYLDGLRGKTVFCKALNADVEIRKKGIKKYLSTSSNPIKLQIAGALLDIIKNGKVFKPSVGSYNTDEVRNGTQYHYLKTPFVIDGVEYGARVVVREDNNGKFHYDLQVKDVTEMLDSLELYKNSPREFQLYDSALACLGHAVDYTEELMESQDNTMIMLDKAKEMTGNMIPKNNLGYDQSYENSSNFNNPSQEFFEDDDAMLDNANSKMVLNLFIFDEYGNEITDDEPVGEAYSSDNPHAKYANDDALIKQNADNWENRLPRLTGDKVAEYNAKANPLGYVGDNEPRHASVGLYNLEKWVDVGDRRYTVKIDGKFKNFASDESWDKPTDFEVYAEIIENGQSNAWRNADDEQYYKATNDFDEALAQAEHWLEMAKQLELNQDEPTDEPVVLTGKELGEFDLTTDGGQQQLLNKVVEKLQELKGAYVFNKSLNANVKLNSRGLDKIRKYNGLDKSPVKLQAVAKLTDIIANAKLFKTDDSYDTGGKKGGLIYYYLKTPFVVDGSEYGARIVIRGDGNGKFYYDLQVKDGASVIFDSMEVKNPLGQGHSIRLEATSNGFDEYSTQTNAESQADDAMLDSLKSGYVLNLFIFDEHGNEITDDEPAQSSQVDASTDERQQIDVSAIDTDLSKYDGKPDEQAKAFFDEQLKGKVVKTQIGDVHILGSSWKHKLKQGIHKDELKAKAIPFIPAILAQGKYEGEQDKYKARSDEYIAFHAFMKEVQIDDNMVGVRLLVGEREKNQFQFVVYNAYPNAQMDALKNPNLSDTGNARAVLGFNDIVLDEADDVNAKNKALDSLTVVNATGLSKACNDSVLDEADDVNSMPQDGTVFDGVMFDDIEDGTDGWNIEIISITPIQEAVMNPNYTQDDIDYLNSIVNGSTNPLEVDFERLIAIGEKDDTDPLFEQANDVISQALDQATQGE